MDEQLIEAALAVRGNAYAPYSRFLVGAALRTKSGRLFTGVNVENASYGLTICAERAAIFQAVAAGEKEFSSMAIAVDAPFPAAPCGACRQVMAEFGLQEIILCTTDKQVKTFSLAELLPEAFVKENLSGGDRNEKNK